MFWGKRSSDDATAPAGAISGHVDDWEGLAVDYVDGRLDPQAATLVEQHLAGCPDCAARLQHQRYALACLREAPLLDAPMELEDKILDEVLWPSEPARTVRVYEVEQRSGRSPAWQRRAMRWIPATIVVLAVLVGVVGFGILRSGLGGEKALETTTMAAAAPATDATNADTMVAAEATGEGGPTATTAGAALPGATLSTAAPMVTTVAGPRTSESTLKAFGPAVQDRTDMITVFGSVTNSPVYFLFENAPPATAGDEGPSEVPTTTVPSPITGDGDTVVTAEQAQALAVQITALTGLEPLGEALSFHGPTFAAYVPRDDTTPLIDLLRSIGTSLGLTVSLTLEPGPAVTEWLPTLLGSKTEFVELSATRTPSPAVSSWSFTTSTLVPPTENAAESPTVVTPDDAGTHLLVAILVNVLP
jgi:anti-sigma factor RsiW